VNDSAQSAAEMFYSSVLLRIRRLMIALALIFSSAACLRFGWRIALGFFCGCVIAYLNFDWLDRVVTALADRATESAGKPSSSGVVFRFLMRYFLMAAAGYVIFTVSRASLYGLLAGLFLPVAAIACEAAYEVYAALQHGV